MGTTSRFFGVTTGFCISNLVLVVLNRLSVIYANWCQHTAHAKARFTPVGVNIQAATFRLQPLRFGIAERGKFDNVSYTPLAVAISKSELTEYEKFIVFVYNFPANAYKYLR